MRVFFLLTVINICISTGMLVIGDIQLALLYAVYSVFAAVLHVADIVLSWKND